MDASVDLNLTSCDFSSVVYSYQEQYTAYLASSQALEDGTEGRQTHAITLLTDCIATSTQTITTPVTIHLNNDGKNCSAAVCSSSSRSLGLFMVAISRVSA